LLGIPAADLGAVSPCIGDAIGKQPEQGRHF
jgi:hypothetical protein